MTSREKLMADLARFGFLPGSGTVIVDEARVRRLIRDAGEMLGPDVTCAMVGGEDGGVVNEFQGIQGLADAWADWLATFEKLELTAESVCENDEYIVALGRQVGVSALAGIEIESEAAALWQMPGETLLRVEFHLHHATALQAGGLSPTA